MRPDRAWVRLSSGRRLDLIAPQPTDWTDLDLAVGLSRTYRWGGHSIWDLPLSVTQHSLLVLVLRQQIQPHQPLTPGEALRELLHDADEGLVGFDPISPLKPHLGSEFSALTSSLQKAIAVRYSLPAWSAEDQLLHKRADHLAAFSEALHVAGQDRLLRCLRGCASDWFGNGEGDDEGAGKAEESAPGGQEFVHVRLTPMPRA